MKCLFSYLRTMSLIFGVVLPILNTYIYIHTYMLLAAFGGRFRKGDD